MTMAIEIDGHYKGWMTLSQAVAYTTVNKKLLMAATHVGEGLPYLPHTRVGIHTDGARDKRRYKFKVEDLDQWMLACADVA